MLGGFSPAAANDAGVEAARRAVEAALAARAGAAAGPMRVTVLEAASQVVAGTNWRLTVRAEDPHFENKTWHATVWARLPHEGGAYEVTKLEEAPAGEAQAAHEGAADAAVDDAAAYAVEALSARSNSLTPYTLLKVESAERVGAPHGEKAAHRLRLRLRRGAEAEEVFDVVVSAEGDRAHALESAAPAAA